MNLQRNDFPSEFVFGVATSSYQIEGHGFGDAGKTHWDSFAATPGNVLDGSDGSRACDHYHRYLEDLDFIGDAGFNAYRFSTSWARVLPEGSGKPNEEGLDFYDRLVDAICQRNLQPWWTLYHWELPEALANRGGWANRDTALRLRDFAIIIADRIGDRVHAASPINEPWCVAWLSHYLGQHAPGMRDIRMATRAMHHVLLGHGLVTQAWRELGLNNLGAVLNVETALPADSDKEEDRIAALEYDGIYNRWFAEAIGKGEYPEDILVGLEENMPSRWQDDMKQISAPLDWLGVNFYTGKRLKRGASGQFADIEEVPGPLSKTAMGWEICADWLGEWLRRFDRTFGQKLPLYVTENGMASSSGLNDADRLDYLQQHLLAAKQVLKEGVDLRGYFVWSLLDNYEWAWGYSQRFGLLHVDFETGQRTPKDSYHWLKELLNNNDNR